MKKFCHLFVCCLAVLCLSVVVLFPFPQNSIASGYAVYTQGAAALGQGNAVTAHSNDPSAVFFNPALIGKLPGTQIQAGTTFIHSSREFKSSAGGEDKNVSSNYFPSTFFATHQLSSKLSLGLGIFSPFGLGTDWGETWEGRYISTNSELTTFNINPVVCWQVTPKIAVAVGLDYMLMDATLERNIYLAPLPDGHQKFTGDGEGFGFNLGLAIDLTDKATLGFHYRSAIDLDLDGKAEFTLPLGTPAPIAALLSNSAGETSITLPQQVQLGFAYDFSDQLTVEIGARWEDWSVFKSLDVKLDNGLTTVSARDWKDVYAFNIGGQYALTPNVTLLAGYLFDDSPAPDRTFDPSIPAAKAHIFSLGGEYARGDWQVAVAYAYQHYESRDKDNSIGLLSGGVANGEYKTDNHMVALSLLYRFN